MRKGWTQTPSGRWVIATDTKKGYMACHAWPSGRWEITRGKESIGRGSVFIDGLEGAMKAAEERASQIIESEA